MKTLRRPMFRKGGEVGGGIMTGVMRENYDDGTPKPSERIRSVLQEYSQPAFDPVSQLLIQGGLNTMSQTGGGGLLGNVAKAFQEPTGQLFEDMSKRKAAQRDIALEGVIADIGQEQTDQTNTIKKQIADEKLALQELELKQKATQFDKEQQTKIDVEIQKGKNKIAELQFKLDNPGADPAKAGVIPSIITQQMEREKSYADSDNLELQMQPDFHARKTVNFERTAPPEILENYRGIVYYNYGRGGDIERTLPPGAGKAGDIIYDPQQSGFFIFDNQGNTYRYDPATNTAVE